MSAFGMKPQFHTHAEYKEWIGAWKNMYREVSEHLRAYKRKIKTAQREGNLEELARLQKGWAQEAAMASKAMTLLEEAKIRMRNITEMARGIREQHATFPVTIENVKNMDFHFNKKHLEFPGVVPMWILKAKGQTFYVHHVDCETPWTTREQPDNPSTKGAIRIRRGNIHIDENANAVIS